MTLAAKSPAYPQLTLAECQQKVTEMMQAHGWQERSSVLQTVMLAEEVGEIAKAIRHLELKGRTPENVEELALELADTFNYVCWLATQHDIDLNDAFQRKIDMNKTRIW